MSSLLPVINDMIIIMFDLMLYIVMFPLRMDKKYTKVYIYIGSSIIIVAYFIVTYILQFPAAVSSAVCMSIPSFILFFVFAKYRDSRFVLTFCFIDTVSLIIAFIGRAMGMLLTYGEVYAVITMTVLFLLLLCMSRKYADKYRQLLDEVDAGWGLMAFSTALIYFAMIFFAGYPKPMVERTEYLPIWLVFALVVISCYIVFIHSVLKTKKISEQKKRLEREKEVYRMAFNDGLTGLYNRASYMEKINQLERQREEFSSIGFVVADVNQFKQVNDTMGHYIGDKVLIAVADAMKFAFTDYKEYIFRMGGDEFLVIMPDVTEEAAIKYISQFRKLVEERQKGLGIKTTVAVGYEILMAGDRTSLELAYIHADKKMYMDKQAVSKILYNETESDLKY